MSHSKTSTKRKTVYLLSYLLTDERDLMKCKKIVSKSRIIVNFDIIRKYFYSLQFTCAGKERAQPFCRKTIFPGFLLLSSFLISIDTVCVK